MQTNGKSAIYAQRMASAKSSWACFIAAGGRFWIEPRELREDELSPEGMSAETLLLTTDDITVNPMMPPRDRKKETIAVTMAR
jgi:hypothetical protein